MAYTHFDKLSVKDGGDYAVGSKGAETIVITSAGVHQTSAGTELLGAVPMNVVIPLATTAAATVYTTAPVAGAVTGYTVFGASAGTGRQTTVTVGAAGAVLLQTAVTGANGTVGKVVAMTNTSGTTTTAAGGSLKVSVTSCATAQVSAGVTLIFTPTA